MRDSFSCSADINGCICYGYNYLSERIAQVAKLSGNRLMTGIEAQAALTTLDEGSSPAQGIKSVEEMAEEAAAETEAALAQKVQILRRQLDQERRARLRLQQRLEQEIKLTEKRIKGHLSYRLGREMVACGRSPWAWLSLPLRALRIYAQFRRDGRGKPDFHVKPAPQALVELYQRVGCAGVKRHILGDDTGVTARSLARQLVYAGQALDRAGVKGAELALTAEAVSVDGSAPSLRARFWACHRAADYDGAHAVANRLWKMSQEQDLGLDEQARLERVFRHPVRQLAIMDLVQKFPDRELQPHKGRLCYLLHNSLPHSSGGYATRSHGLAAAVAALGWDVRPITRPGFPYDVILEPSSKEVATEEKVDGISYRRLFEPSRRGIPPSRYMELAAGVLERELQRLRPEVVVAASNHLTALPGLIAARRLGIPFFYEVRGLWEVTRLSREPEFAHSINFWIQKSLEAGVACRADGVFTLTEAMREELKLRGVPGDKIKLLPNCCDTRRFQPRERDNALRVQLGIPADVPVIGYVGTFVSYEGLEDLTAACGLLKRRGVSFRLLLVGNEDASGSGRGAITEVIHQAARREGFADWVIMPGRVSHELVPNYYSLIDITPFPRKPLPVCEMVSPIKPLEAMAMGKAVVVSDVRALNEMVQEGETGLLFQKGNVEDLADKLQLLLADPKTRERLGEKGRLWVKKERSWARIAMRLSAALEGAREEGRRPQATPLLARPNGEQLLAPQT